MGLRVRSWPSYAVFGESRREQGRSGTANLALTNQERRYAPQLLAPPSRPARGNP
jgi:hypothetical protein